MGKRLEITLQAFRVFLNHFDTFLCFSPEFRLPFLLIWLLRPFFLRSGYFGSFSFVLVTSASFSFVLVTSASFSFILVTFCCTSVNSSNAVVCSCMQVTFSSVAVICSVLLIFYFVQVLSFLGQNTPGYRFLEVLAISVFPSLLA